MKKLLLFFAVLATAITASAEDYILYTSSDKKVVEPNPDSFDAKIVSNTYENGQGKILFDDEVSLIGDYAFESRTNLKTIVLPNSVTEIGSNAFWGCSDLSTIEMSESLSFIGDYSFQECSSLSSVVIPNSVKTIGFCAFNGGCTNLISAVIGNSVTEIPDFAFGSCTALASVEIGNSVTSIGEYAFNGCALTSVVIPNSVKTIGKDAFSWCEGLKTLVIGNSVQAIEKSAFNYCFDLKEITSLAVTPPSITSNSFHDVTKFGGKLKVPMDAVEAYKAAENWCEFQDIVGFEVVGKVSYEVNPVNNTVTVTVNADTKLAGNVEIESTIDVAGNKTPVGEIASAAFQNQSEITSVSIPETISMIGENAFAGCSGLTSITCNSTTPPTIHANTFDGVNKGVTRTAADGICVLKVPAESVELYRTTEYWSEFQLIEGIDNSINGIAGLTPNHDTKAYNLQGVEVGAGYRGIVVKGGKKILKK